MSFLSLGIGHPLGRQDPSKWDQAAINAGTRYFAASIRGETDWTQIVRHYDQLCEQRYRDVPDKRREPPGL